MGNNTEKGIVLIEAIVAVGVLATIFTAVMSLYLSSIEGTRMTNDQLIATFLAQDAMEQIIAKKQYNYFYYDDLSENWLEGLGNCTAGLCSVDYNNPSNNLNSVPTACVDMDACRLFYSGSKYTATGAVGDESYFSRAVRIYYPSALNPDEARVVVTVAWQDGATPMEYTLTYNMYRNPNIQ